MYIVELDLEPDEDRAICDNLYYNLPDTTKESSAQTIETSIQPKETSIQPKETFISPQKSFIHDSSSPDPNYHKNIQMAPPYQQPPQIQALTSQLKV